MNKQRFTFQSAKSDSCANIHSFTSKKRNDITPIIIGIVLYNYIYSYSSNILLNGFLNIICTMALLALLTLWLKK